MSLDRRRLRSLGIIGAVVLLGAGGYALYHSLRYGEEEKEGEKNHGKAHKYTSKPITIILTDSIISSNLPINEILLKTEDVVLVIPPNLSKDDLNEKLDKSIDYKVIECETNDGVWSATKHLGSEVIFIVKDDLNEDIPKGLERYVGEIIELEQNFTYINQKVLSYIIN